MLVTQMVLFILIGIFGTVVVLTRDPLRQCIVAGFFGLLLTLLLFVIHAQDVSLAAIVVSTIGLPMMILLALAKVRSHK